MPPQPSTVMRMPSTPMACCSAPRRTVARCAAMAGAGSAVNSTANSSPVHRLGARPRDVRRRPGLSAGLASATGREEVAVAKSPLEEYLEIYDDEAGRQFVAL